MPGGGISADGSRWIGSSEDYLLPAPVLSRLFRDKMLAMLKAAHEAGRLQFFADHAHLADKAAFKSWLEPLYDTKWHVHAKRPFAGPQQVLAYMARYTHRVAISNSRLIKADETGVTFRYKDYRVEGLGRYKTMTVAPGEFIRRFILHVLPKGFHRMRHYGLLASSRTKADTTEGARELIKLATPPQPPRSTQPDEAPANTDATDKPSRRPGCQPTAHTRSAATPAIGHAGPTTGRRVGAFATAGRAPEGWRGAPATSGKILHGIMDYSDGQAGQPD